MTQRRRLDARYAIHFPVQLLYSRRSQSLMTEDVSEGGIFLCTDAPPPLLQLVQVQLILPIGGYALRAHGMTVHVVEPNNAKGRVAGIGVQFYALDRATRDAWEAFTRHVESHCPPSPDQTPLKLRRGETPEPLTRRFGRHTAVLDLKPSTLESLEEIYSRDVSNGTMFVPTHLELMTGTSIVINVTHPVSHTPFLFEAKVLRRTDPPAGVHVELSGVDKRFREDFLDFVRGPILAEADVSAL